MTNPIYRQNIKKIKVTAKYTAKTFDYTTTADQLRTVSWSKYSCPTGVIKLVCGIPTITLTTKAVHLCMTSIETLLSNH